LIASNSAFEGATKLTTEDLNGWECSVHISFPTFPADWIPMAVATDTPTKPTCGNDPNTKESACGQAYVLVAGSGIVATAPNLTLELLSHTDPVGGTHSVTATVTEEHEEQIASRRGASALFPAVETPVSFAVTGHNNGVAGVCTFPGGGADAECKTDVNGQVVFTYPDTNGAGEDTINASVLINRTTQHATAAEIWTALPTQLTTSLAGAGQSGEKIAVAAGAAVTDQATLHGEDAIKANGTVSYSVYSDAACTQLVTTQVVNVTTGSVATSSPVTLSSPGTYYWAASYGGDSFNASSVSKCGDEQVTVTAPPAAAAQVLAAKVTAAPAKGTARAASIRGCLAQSGYLASVRGTSIASVTFTLDGHAIKTLRKPTSGSTFTARLNVRSGSAHHLAMRVVFTASSKTPTATFRRTLARCAARKVALPRFTG
jgi:hypothetical protein